MVELFSGDTQRGSLTVVQLRLGDTLVGAPALRAPIVCGAVLADADWQETLFCDLIDDLIRHGVVYFAFYGPRCEEAHDLADAVRDELLISTDERVVMTTWHDRESLVDYLWFVGFAAMPSEGYSETGPVSYLIVEIGESATGDLLSAVREVFL